MKRYILTGAPGAGKTVILRLMERRGYAVVEEAATDVHALEQAQGNSEPWRSPRFVDDIVGLQRLRQERRPGSPSTPQIFDRSPVCTLALARFLGFPVSDVLARELDRIERQGVYERRAFFIESLGFITNTEARRISLDDAAQFGEAHEAAYREFGFELVRIAPGSAQDRADEIATMVQDWSGSGR